MKKKMHLRQLNLRNFMRTKNSRQ